MTATEIITLYRPSNKTVIAEVQVGENYYIPEDVEEYKGCVEEFLEQNNEYQWSNENL